MKVKARQQAERALAFLGSGRTRKQPIRIMSPFAICDSTGELVAAASRDIDENEFITDEWKNITDPPRKRFGEWITLANPHPTLQRWLTALEWHRRSVEAAESRSELLNAWFSVEHLVEVADKIPLRLPHFLSKRNDSERGAETTWLASPQMRLIQCVLAIERTRDELREFVSKVSGNVLFPSLLGPSVTRLPADIVSLVSDGERSWRPAEFVRHIDRILPELRKIERFRELDDATHVQQLFFEPQYIMARLQPEFWRIKDDVYCIYRIRNMLVHSAHTDSKLLDYYAHRIREYSFSLLNTLKGKLLSTTDDSEIRLLEDYLSEMVIEANLALESLERGDATEYREWVFS